VAGGKISGLRGRGKYMKYGKKKSNDTDPIIGSL
jgi:hypothetical protein